MSKFRPGGFRITDKAMGQWDLPKGSKVIDIGCGCGETIEHLQEKYGYQGKGIDLSLDRIYQGKQRNSFLDLTVASGEDLGDVPPCAYHGALMECVLSVMNKPEETLGQIYSLLKKGGKLFISDLYIKDPAPEFILQLREEGCDFRAEGRFLMGPMVQLLEQIGYENILWEDCTPELHTYVAEKIMADGTLEGCLCEGALHAKIKHKTGYMLLTGEKNC